MRIVDFALTKDDQILIMLASDSSVIFHDLHSNQEITRLKTLKYGEILSIFDILMLFKDDPMGLIVSPDSKFFAVASSKGSLIGFELLSSVDVVEEYRVREGYPVVDLVLTHNQKYLIAAELNGTITVYDTLKQHAICQYDNNIQERIRCVSVSSDDKYVVIGGENKMFMVYRLDASGKGVQMFKEYESQVLTGISNVTMNSSLN